MQQGHGGIQLPAVPGVSSECAQNVSTSQRCQYINQAYYSAIKNRSTSKCIMQKREMNVGLSCSLGHSPVLCPGFSKSVESTEKPAWQGFFPGLFWGGAAALGRHSRVSLKATVRAQRAGGEKGLGGGQTDGLDWVFCGCLCSSLMACALGREWLCSGTAGLCPGEERGSPVPRGAQESVGALLGEAEPEEQGAVSPCCESQQLSSLWGARASPPALCICLCAKSHHPCYP